MSRFPVAWLTTVITVLTGFLATLTGVHALSATQAAWAAGVIAVLTAILGVITHKAVTPLADPKDSAGRELVPAGPAR
jgi:hypothetical protein